LILIFYATGDPGSGFSPTSTGLVIISGTPPFYPPPPTLMITKFGVLFLKCTLAAGVIPRVPSRNLRPIVASVVSPLCLCRAVAGSLQYGLWRCCNSIAPHHCLQKISRSEETKRSPLFLVYHSSAIPHKIYIRVLTRACVVDCCGTAAQL
jgi:hypothetical protein